MFKTLTYIWFGVAWIGLLLPMAPAMSQTDTGAPVYNSTNAIDAFEVTSGAAGQSVDPASGNLIALVGRVVSIILMVLGIVVFIYLIYGGILWMTAAGNEERVTKAKGIIRNGIIGVIIIASAYTISYFIVTGIGAAVGIE